MATFKQIEAFVAFADAGSISAAARTIGIAQSAASKHVSDFEAPFPRPLLDRSGRRAELTVDGAEVLMRARRVLARRDSLLFALSSKELPLKRLRLGVTEVIALTWLNSFLHALRQDFPKVEIDLKVEVGSRLKDELRSGELDIVISPDSKRNHGLLAAKLGTLENHWYCSAALHPGRKSLRPGDLASFDMIMRDAQSSSGLLLQDWLRVHGIIPRSVISSSSLLAVIDLMASGLGIAHLPEPLVRPLLARNQIAELRVRPSIPSVDYVLLVREKNSSKVHKRLIEIASASCNFDVGSTDVDLASPHTTARIT